MSLLVLFSSELAIKMATLTSCLFFQNKSHLGLQAPRREMADATAARGSQPPEGKPGKNTRETKKKKRRRESAAACDRR
ncbi:hypothetical protein [Chromobacterium subtsugae]|uniref:hypothetical protein n=1 Tax=Chromobacterium subtsugae TaxID=251747 RepID=UPI000A62BDD6|nr:hypothetical protein [Chromobacterium subtsugae]